MYKVLLRDWSVDFAMDDESEKSRIKETTNALASFFFLLESWNLGSEKMSIEEYVQLAWEEIVDAEYNMAKLVDLAWSRGI